VGALDTMLEGDVRAGYWRGDGCPPESAGITPPAWSVGVPRGREGLQPIPPRERERGTRERRPTPLRERPRPPRVDDVGH
jgi:hypothetical protein